MFCIRFNVTVWFHIKYLINYHHLRLLSFLGSLVRLQKKDVLLSSSSATAGGRTLKHSICKCLHCVASSGRSESKFLVFSWWTFSVFRNTNKHLFYASFLQVAVTSDDTQTCDARIYYHVIYLEETKQNKDRRRKLLLSLYRMQRNSFLAFNPSSVVQRRGTTYCGLSAPWSGALTRVLTGTGGKKQEHPEGTPLPPYLRYHWLLSLSNIKQNPSWYLWYQHCADILYKA